jgi:hypothetical protein
MGSSSQTIRSYNSNLGASWECFVAEQLSAHLNLNSEELYFWGTHRNAELDLLAFFS